jgi:ABC-type uncharacterized transport system permease subunit
MAGARDGRVLRSRVVRDLGVALIVVFGVGSIAMLLAHVSPIDGFYALFDGAFGTTSEFAETLVSATALLFPALGIALAFRAGLFNIGAEGQLVLGGLAAGVAACSCPVRRSSRSSSRCWPVRSPAACGAASPAFSKRASAPTK